MHRLRIAAVAAITAVVLSTVPAHAAEPFGSTPCPGVRPGALMEAPPGIQYTMGLLFKGTDAKGKVANYITTVANYVFTTFGTKTWKSGTGPDARDGLGKKFGKFVYASHTDTPAYTSFGLILVDKTVKPNAQVCHFGGPTAVYQGTDVTPFAVQYYGQGTPASEASPARTGLVSGSASEQGAYLQGVWGPGDEGGPVLVDGKVLGYLDGGIGGGATSGAGFVVSRIDQWIAKAEKALKIKLRLATSAQL
jgi:hypothetical protein